MRRTAALILPLLLVSACRRGPSGARVDPALAPLVPSQTVMLAGLRLDKLKDTQFYRTYVEGKRIPQLEEFAQKTGLDPRKDVWEIVVATGPDRKTLVLARGKFGDLFGLEPQIKIEGMRRMNYKGYSILGTPQAAVMFMQSGVAVLGPYEDLQRVVDSRDKPGEKPPQALLDLIGSLPATSHFYAASFAPQGLLPEIPREGNFANFARMVTDLRQFTLAADASSDVRVAIQALYGDPAVANQTRDALRGFVGLARLRTPDNQPQLLRLYDNIAIVVQETTLNVSLTAPFDVLQQYVRLP